MLSRTCLKLAQATTLKKSGPLAVQHFTFSTDKFFIKGQSNDQAMNQHDAADHKRVQSSGSQIESEWVTRKAGIDFDPNEDPGFKVPGVFREHRHTYSTKPETRDALLRQITYRVGHIGTKELEIILRDYITLYGGKMSYEELDQFDDEILNMENPSLNRYLVNQEPIEQEHNLKYVRELVLYVQNRKIDYGKYTPGIVYWKKWR